MIADIRQKNLFCIRIFLFLIAVKIQSLTLVVTEDCNFGCTYCYKKKKPDRMTFATMEKALVFFCLS